jgi:hypothetical protein
MITIYKKNINDNTTLIKIYKTNQHLISFNDFLHLCTFKTPNKRVKKYTKM